MKDVVLVIGSGGREHALAWKLAQSPHVGRVYVAPGNAGTVGPVYGPQGEVLGELKTLPIPLGDGPVLLNFLREGGVSLIVIGPEAPLAAGLADQLRAAGHVVFGPSQAAARLEWSKAFAKDFMRAHGVPTADYAVFDRFEAARDFVLSQNRPCVVKADGLAAGKGVILCDTQAEALDALERLMVQREFGEAGACVIIEERLSGRELSVLALSDGKTVTLLPSARDHKRIFDGDRGPNTGGMGAVAPVPEATPALLDTIRRTVLQPTVVGMAARGTPYVGVLYAGLMLTPDGIRVLEFNCRFGDPETQVILPLLETDLYAALLACEQGQLAHIDVQVRTGACATVVLASAGYPGAYETGRPITGLDAVARRPDVMVFHAATARKHGHIVTAGGRVLAVSAWASDLQAALAQAYAGVDLINFDGKQYRSDIGKP